MVEYQAPSLERTFAALANPTRRRLINRLAEGESTVTELARPFDMSLAAVSKHLYVLEEAGLVHRRVEGRQHHLSLNAAPMATAQAWLSRYQSFWDESLDALAELVEDEDLTST
jgi:DNA-binding transcriptional ArsR family regulator